MRPMKVISALVKDEPLNIDERLDRLELDTNQKLQQFDEALGVFKDLVIKLYNEREQLKSENASLKGSLAAAASGMKEAVKDTIVRPLASAGEEFVELLMENNNGKPEQKIIGNPNHVGFNPNTDEMERTIAWMREKFGLPPAQKAVKTKAKWAKKRK